MIENLKTAFHIAGGGLTATAGAIILKNNFLYENCKNNNFRRARCGSDGFMFLR